MSQAKKKAKATEPQFETRPWGEFEIIRSEHHFKAKALRVNPGHQTSYQSHLHRTEYWTVVAGEGVVILDDVTHIAKVGSVFKIVAGQKHRLRNTGKSILEIIEVQLGTYFGEDDITRFEDDYNRK